VLVQVIIALRKGLLEEAEAMTEADTEAVVEGDSDITSDGTASLVEEDVSEAESVASPAERHN
jgi:hypothetical protein